MKKRYLLFVVIAAMLVLSPLLFYLINGDDQGRAGDPATLPTPTPIQTNGNQTNQTVDPEDIDHELAPTQNPEYIEKIARQPFWDQLPYWDPQKNYNIEYMDSADQIIITSLIKGPADKAKYEQQARAWLQANGADLGELDIQYKTVSSN